MENQNGMKKSMVTLAAVAGLSSGLSHADFQMPRGAEIGSAAANCTIGPFPQTTKAGGYNVLCEIMQDNEKCLALVKSAFQFNGETVTVEPLHDVEKGRFCLEVLRRDLGLTVE